MKAIRVGHLVYNVLSWPANEASSSQRLGECDRHNLNIRVKEGMPPHLNREITLHEVLHACWDISSLPEDGVTEEQAVVRLSKSILMVLRDNPHLAAHLLEK
jgi:hypothetical protein